MIALKILSQVIPVLNREDRCSQALGWMEIFRVSHLPVVEGDEYLGLLEDETIYAHGNLEDPIASLEIRRESTFVYEDTYIYVLSVWLSRNVVRYPRVEPEWKIQRSYPAC